MSERGVFAVDRGIFTDPDFADEPLTEREAWMWLISEAAWKPRERRVGAKVYQLGRGQLVASVRFLATAWKWGKSSVQRFLRTLEEQNKIKIERHGTDLGQITICKYDAYQRVALPTGTDVGQSWDKLEDIKTIKSTEEDSPSGATVVAFPISISPEKAVFDAGKHLLGKSSGGVIQKLRKACSYDDVLAAEYLRQASEKQDPMEWLQAVLRASLPENRAYVGVEGVDLGAKPIPLKGEREYADWRDDPIYRGVL